MAETSPNGANNLIKNAIISYSEIALWKKQGMKDNLMKRPVLKPKTREHIKVFSQNPKQLRFVTNTSTTDCDHTAKICLHGNDSETRFSI